MKKTHRRIIVYVATLFAIALIVSLFGQIWSYFKSGATFSELKAIDEELWKVYDPVTTWDSGGLAEGLPMDQFTREDVEQAYLRAWHALNLAGRASNLELLEDYFSGPSLEHLRHLPKSDDVYFTERVNLEHNIRLNLFSLDRQVVAFTDSAMQAVVRITNGAKDELLLHNHSEESFEVIMTLDDGHWKVRHLSHLQSNNRALNDVSHSISGIRENLKGVNYYPSASPWFSFWADFDTLVIAQDFELISELGLEAIRIFIPYSTFGKNQVDPVYVQRLNQLLNLAVRFDLLVVPTLFDFPEGYQIDLYTQTRRHLIEVVDRFKDHSHILAWDLKNEPDLDFEVYGESTVLEWLKLMIATIREIDPSKPVTIGWSKATSAHLLADKLDIISFHFYEQPSLLTSQINALRQKVDPEKPLWLTEFGKSSLNSFFFPGGASEAEQAAYIQNVLFYAQEAGVNSNFVWTLHDFQRIPGGVFGWKPWIKKAQKQFGLVNAAGIKKKSAQVILDQEQISDTRNTWAWLLKPFYFTCLLVLFLVVLLARRISRGYF